MRVLMAPTLAYLGQAGKVLILVLLELWRKERGTRWSPKAQRGDKALSLSSLEEDHFQKHLDLLSLEGRWQEGSYPCHPQAEAGLRDS